jgi:polar amino acid transport system ATP-binding protein
MVFQNFNLFPHMTTLDNVTLAPVRTGKMSKEEAEAKTTVYLESQG